MIKKMTLTVGFFAAMCSASLAASPYWTTSSVTFRDGPGTYNQKLGTIARCVRVQITDKQDGWYRITWGGNWGWVAAKYVSSKASYCGGYKPAKKSTSGY